MTPEQARDYLGMTTNPKAPAPMVDLEALAAKHAKATTPWKLAEPVDGGIPTIYPDTGKMEFPIAWRPDFIKVEVWLDHAAAIVALHNAYPDLKALIDAQAATIARLREALQVIVDDYQTSPKHHPNDILIPIASFGLACAALTGAA